MKSILGIALAIVAVVFLQLQFDIFHLRPTALQIDKTANVVEEIKKINEFTTVCFYEEMVLKDQKKNEGVFSMVSNDDELVVVARGTVRAGFNLSKLAESIKFTGDTVSFALPEAEIFDVIINPSDYDVFVESGSWTHEQTVALVSKAQQQVREDALANDILKTATSNGEKKLAELFKAFGFNVVNIN